MLNWSGGILGYILYVPENPALCKSIGLTLSVLTWQILVTCFQDTNADSVVRVVSTLHSQQLLFLLTPLEETWMLGYVFLENPNPDSRIQIRICESKNGFWVFLDKSKNGSWIQKIHSQGGFFGSNPIPDFRDSKSERFFGKGFEKNIFDKRFFEKIMVWTYVGGVLLSLSHIIPCLLSIQIIGPLLLMFFCTYVVSAYAGFFSKLKKTIHRLQF